MMKKTIVLTLFLLFILTGCAFSKDDENLSDVNDPNSEDIRYDTGSHDGENIDTAKFADVSFTDYTYTPFTQKLCFTINITDTSYRSSEYWLIQRPEGSTRTESQVSFTIDSESDSVYHCEGYTPGYEIVIGKYNKTEHYDSTTLEPLAWITAEDDKHHERVWTESHHFIEKDLPTDSKEANDRIKAIGSPYIAFEFMANDPHRVYEGIYLEVYYRPFDTIYKTMEIPLTEDMYDGDQLLLPEIIIDELPPDVTFDVYYYLKGTDGVEDYDYTQFGYRTETSSTTGFTSFVKNAYPGLWADITNWTIGEKTTTITYNLHHTGKVKYRDEPVTVGLSIYDTETVFPLEVGENVLEIDNALLSNFDVLQIIVNETEDVLTQQQLRYGLHNLFEHFNYGDGMFSYRLNNFNVDIESIDYELRTVEEGTPILTGTLTEFPKNYDPSDIESIPVTTIPNNYDGHLYLTYTVTYLGFEGIETQTTTQSAYRSN